MRNSKRASLSNVLGASVAWKIVALLCFTVVFLIVTINVIAPQYYYLGFVQREFILPEIVVGGIITVCLGMVVATRENKPSSYAQAFLIATVAIPVVWVPVLYGPLSTSQVLALQLVTLLNFISISIVTGIRTTGVRTLRVPAESVAYILAVLSLTGFSVLVFGLGLTPEFIGLSEVYDHREEYNEAMPVGGRYMVGLLVNSMLPVIFSIGVVKKSLPLIIFAMVGLFSAYSITGFRSFLVGVGILAAGALVFGVLKRGPAGWFGLFTAVMVGGWLVDLYSGGIEWTSLVTRRAIATAGINTSYYIDYFSNNPTYGLKHSVLSWMGESPYKVPPPTLIGSTYYASEPNANANFMADGYANFGWIGMFAAAIAVGVLLRVYDALTMHLPVAFSVLSFTMVLVSLSNSAVLTVIMTHGAAATALLASCVTLERRKWRGLPVAGRGLTTRPIVR